MPVIHLNEAAEPVEERLRLTLTCISELRGAYPEIGLPDDIDRNALGDGAFFVTLPIGQAGTKSRNGRRYSRAAVEQMVAQINARRPEGMWGHIAPEENATRYDPPAMRWLAAVIDAEGIVWGKGLPLTEQTREYYRLAKATNARVGTSLVAWAQMDGDEVKALELVTVDLADPARVGVPMTAAKAHLSKEMRTTEDTEITEKDSAQRYRVKQSFTEANLRIGQDAEGGEASEMVALREMLGGGDVVARVDELLAEQRAFREEREALIDAVITAAVERAVRVPMAVGLVEQMVRARLHSVERTQTLVEIGDAVAAVVTSEVVQAFLRDAVAQAAGPAQRRPIRREGEAGFFSF